MTGTSRTIMRGPGLAGLLVAGTRVAPALGVGWHLDFQQSGQQTLELLQLGIHAL